MGKPKLLMLSDDMRTYSGVATISRELILGTVKKFDWIQVATKLSPEEVGNVIDISEDVKQKTGVEDASVYLIPYNSYGDINLLRNLLSKFKIDGIVHFTDPHQWVWLYLHQHEIRQKVPLMYYHVWDNTPDPIYNKPYLTSNDWIGAISKLTYGMVNRLGTQKFNSTDELIAKDKIDYVPHGINPKIYKPIESISQNVTKFIHNGKYYDFVLFYNNRNIVRKQPLDVINSYKTFCDKIGLEKSKNTLLLMHTDEIDQSGTNLNAYIETINQYNIKIFSEKIDEEILNQFYNSVDCTINLANTEGFGLTTAESLMAGTMIIANVTGGLQDQMGFNVSEEEYIEVETLSNKKNLTHGKWCEPVFPKSRSLTGTIATPYIYTDYVDVNDVAKKIEKIYNLTKEQRKKNGLLGREYMLKNFSTELMCEKFSEGIIKTLNNFTPTKKYDIFKI